MDAAVSLHGALPLPLPLPASRALHHLNPASSSSSSSAKQHQQPRARLAVTAARPSSSSSKTLARAASSSSAAAVPPVVQVQQQHRLSSSRAATGYAAALADASLRAGTLARAARHARALLVSDDGAAVVTEDSRVVALVRMLVGKGKAAMVADVMAEFVAICDRLLLLPARAHAATSY
uniref:Uncharacterized protein n=1 Tax=Oryza punctata TaxID=4537 RepID=A0A0E0LFN1_ORYPU